MGAGDKYTSRWRAGSLALTAAVVVAVPTGATALGAGQASGTAPVPAQSLGSSVATCRPGTGVVANGFEAPAFAPGDNAAAVARISSRRVGARKVATDAFNFGGQAGDIVSLAYCARSGKAIRVNSNSVLVPPGSEGSSVASCPRRSWALGGGFEAPGFSKSNGPEIITLTSMRAGKRSWMVAGFNQPPEDSGQGGGSRAAGEPGVLVAYVYCAKSHPKLVSTSRQAVVPTGSLTTVDAACPHGTRALGGGFDGNFQPSGQDISAAGAITSERVAGGRAWRISALSISDTTPAIATAYAYCLRP